MKKPTGIVRKLDNLGRIVIPKEIRRTMKLKVGELLGIFTSDEGEVIFKKNKIANISIYSDMYAEILHTNGGLPCIVSNVEHVLSAYGVTKKEVCKRRLTSSLADVLKNKKNYSYTDIHQKPIKAVDGTNYYVVASSPIVISGDTCGSISYISNRPTYIATNLQIRLITIASVLISNQIESSFSFDQY